MQSTIIVQNSHCFAIVSSATDKQAYPCPRIPWRAPSPANRSCSGRRRGAMSRRSALGFTSWCAYTP